MVLQEVVVPDREPAPLVGHVLVHAVVRLARGRSLGRQGVDEIAATPHDFQFYDFAPPETRAMLARMATLAEFMTREVLIVAPEDTIGEAAQKMVDEGVSSVVVSDFGRLIGILTERDLTRAVAGRTHSSEARVREWMTADPVTLPPSASPKEAAEIMLEQGFRHIPVVDGERAMGIVSIRDVARWSAEEG